MRFTTSLLLAMALMAASTHLQAQDNPVYVVSYIEVAPGASAPAASLLRQLANASGKDEGNLRLQILQRVAPSNQFAIVAIWKDQKSYDAHTAATHSKEFRDKIKPHLISAIDERLHNALDVAPTGSASTPGEVFVVTHVDVPPPKKDDCIALLKTLVDASRKETGVLRFDVLQQVSRPNHFSVVETWKGQNAYVAHVTAAHTKSFREQLTPMSGALYDERLYKSL
jgi:quinol monooxygenase YgiN